MYIGHDGGGFLITAHGIIRIPPWNPDILGQFKALGALTRLATGLDRKTSDALIGESLTLLTKSVEDIVAKAGGERPGGIFYYDPEDGFVCGNGIRPFPWPRPHLAELDSRGPLHVPTGKRTTTEELAGSH